ncbi:MAG: AraC family transcriptional regulator [Verrucomicrobia bacterium]|nr:AraC family transcriptional regulator [Lachnospiraceae bacterium]MBR4249081.1 AraC family transcriptional regulator [Verrucomicrobiota bacterium]
MAYKHKLSHIVDNFLTPEEAQSILPQQIVVTWFTNKLNTQSVVHSHPYYEAILPIKGGALYSSGGSLYQINEGDMILFPRGVFHSGRYNINTDISERLVTQIDGAFWNRTSIQRGLQHSSWEYTITIITAEMAGYWDLRGLFESMARTEKLPKRLQESVYQGQLTEFMCILKCLEESSSFETPPTANPLAAAAVKFLQDNYKDPLIGVNDVADYCFVSREHLSRIFKEYTMQSVHGYLTTLRMQSARVFISEGRNILEASMESGFSDYSSFVKTFKKLYGITPSEYRKSLR